MSISRRSFIGVVSLPMAMASAVPAAIATGNESIRQPATADAAHIMARAEEMRQRAIDSGDQAFGAVVVKDRRIVGQAPSRVIVNRDPTAHAEMEAIRDAARRLETNDLSDCVIYSTSRPCRMCETAAYWANLARSHSGEAITDNGQPRYTSC